MYDERLELGPSPANEDCVQVGVENYSALARAECKRYIAQLNKQFAHYVEQNLISFGIISYPHDFGRYLEVVVNYDDKNEESVQAAFDVESNAWTEWRD